ncbi:hypothetical protein BAUCODRAFT_149471 [Baudoinia panamericana UAMH 10762]|uniref:Something about silencing protein 4 domain-containing protein n=1 Tax=Baudoinia panamericana (strain UAMH 10762) TaxID=717646 RepID=M2MVB7_BAUPA|nr:uncharacterized protein BAUCODRAFT_149471 [Baudoinia panamericana UAMH 10762]EMC95513.1 hypothetical protein BAUCODRAFT_149471 [Baudoinia panamericana UAMH 10762]
MPSHTRPSRVPRTAGGQFARHSDEHASLAKAASASASPPAARSSANHHQHTPPHPRDAAIIADSDSNGFHEEEGRPAKKRRLTIRHRHNSSEHLPIAQSSAETKPPTKVTVAQPHGQLLETLNGVRTALNVDEDAVAEHGSEGGPPAQRILPPPKPAPPPNTKEDKRTLRSHDEGPRLKSELAVYFPNFEDVIFGVEKEEEFITTDTVLYVTDDAPKQSPHTHTTPHKAAPLRPDDATNGVSTTPIRTLTDQHNGCPTVDLDVLARNIPPYSEDPLSDTYYGKSHRRAERREKQLRNIEKERAMHEKVQLERLLEGLQGHDWLKVLGITGITDGEAKKYEPKRDYFIEEVKALVDKFRLWKEQERKQKMERDAAAARDAGETEGEESGEGSVEPPSSEMNARASRQLQQETMEAVKSGFKIRLGKRPSGAGTSVSATPTPTPTSHPLPPPPLPVPYVPPEPMTSFYAKRHLRDAALGKARHGRNVTAFGHPIPEVALAVEKEFELPEEFVTQDTLRANARERRRRKRAGIVDAAGAAEVGSRALGV